MDPALLQKYKNRLGKANRSYSDSMAGRRLQNTIIPYFPAAARNNRLKEHYKKSGGTW